MENNENKEKPRKGAILQFFGCVLLFLGFLNTMLTIKANIPPDPTNHVLMASGAALLIVGIWRSR